MESLIVHVSSVWEDASSLQRHLCREPLFLPARNKNAEIPPSILSTQQTRCVCHASSVPFLMMRMYSPRLSSPHSLVCPSACLFGALPA